MKEGTKKPIEMAVARLFPLFFFSFFLLPTSFAAHPDSNFENYPYGASYEDSPEIGVFGISIEIFSGSPTTSLTNHTNFGFMYPSSGSVTRTYTISNTGGAALNISGVSISGGNADQFNYTNPITPVVAPGASTTFTVVFDPSSEGDKFATVNILSDDTDEPSFTFSIDGSGFPPKPVVVSGITSDDILNTCYFPWEIVNGLADYRSHSNIYIYSDGTKWIIGDYYHPTTIFFSSVGSLTPSVWDVEEWVEGLGTGNPVLSDFDPIPNINIKGNKLTIEMGDPSPSFLDHTNFGAINIASGSRDRYFTIQNTSGGDLRWSTITIDGPDAPSFSVLPPMSKSVPTYAYTNFKVTFNPSTVGKKTATVTITSNDTDESPWIFTISGDGFSPKNILVSGITAPVDANGTYLHMGILNEYQYWKHETLDYYILNTTFSNERYWGIDNNLTGLTPSDLLFYTESESIDPVDISGWIAVVGESGLPSIEFTTPEIGVKGNNQVITDGDSSPSSLDHTLFGAIGVESGSISRTYSIFNEGNADLSLTGNPVVSITGTNAGDFSVTTQPNTSINAGGESAFSISFDPLASGERSAVVSISNNDDDENPYTFSIGGTGQTVPSVNTSTISSLSYSSVTLNGEVVSDGSDPVLERGFVYYASNGDPQIDGEGVVSVTCPTSGTGNYSAALTGLTVSTPYYYRAYATNSTGTSYGDVGEFTTLNRVVSFVATAPITTNAPTVGWQIDFAAEVTGLSAGNFSLHGTGAIGAYVSEITGSGTSWTITVTTGTGSDQLYFGLANSSGLNNGIANLTVYGDTYFIDKVAPSLSSSSPTDNSTKMYPGANIVLGFDDFMSVYSGKISIYNSDGSLFEQIDATSQMVTIYNLDVTINPTKPLVKGHTYYVVIDTTALLDDAGNYFKGLRDNTSLNFSTVDVTINEVDADPQNDWSTNGFNGIPATGTISGGTDEWVELYINSQGIDFTGWTIELLDGTDVIGNLTNSGAFDNSVYTGTGNFTNTSIGDYLVLGNVDGSGAINNTCTIKLKDPYGAIVDSVSFGSTPTINSSDTYDESAQRFPNGSSTNSPIGWVLGPASMGSANTGPCIKLSLSKESISEDGEVATITAKMSGAVGSDVTVELAFSGTASIGEDLLLSATTITIAAGNSEGSVTATTVPNKIDQNDRTLVIDISSVSLGTEAGEQQTVLTITDDDDPPKVELSVVGPQITENGDTAYVRATLSSPSSFVVGVNLILSGTALGDGVDFTLPSETIDIVPGELGGTIKLVTVPNELAEGHKTIAVGIGSVTNGTEEGEQQVEITVLDDDFLPIVDFDVATATSIGENGNITIAIEASSPSGREIIVPLSILGLGTALEGIDFSLSSDTLSIPVGSTYSEAVLTIIADGFDEEAETVVIGFGAITNAIGGEVTQTVITITDDDSTPTIASGQKYYVIENAVSGTTMGSVLADDSDEGDVLLWSITGGSGEWIFGINSNTGELTLVDNSTLDPFETPSYQLQITITDGSNTSEPAEITVTVTGVNDEPPEITGNRSFEIDENSVNGTMVGMMGAFDPDYGCVLEWTLISGNIGNTFSLSVTGELVINKNDLLDYESTKSMALGIRVTDGLHSDETEVTVSIKNLNDNIPDVGEGDFSILEGSVEGTFVGKITAIDFDGDPLSYSITSGNTGEAFTIDDSGNISINQGGILEFDIIPFFELEITVGDGTNQVVVTAKIEIIEDPETSLQDISTDKFNFYPNPATEFITIEIIGGQYTSGIVDIYGINGQKYISKVITNGTVRDQITVKELKPGIYFIKFSSGNRQIIKKLVIK